MIRAKGQLTQQLEVQLVHGFLHEHLVGDLGDELRLARANHRRDSRRLSGIRRVALLQLSREGDLRGVRVRDRDLRKGAVALDDVDGAPVRGVAHGELRNVAERLPVVERAGERVTGGHDERTLLLDDLAIVDVGRSADPELDVSGVIAHRHGPAQVPAVRAVAGPEAVLHLVRLAGSQRLLAARHGAGEIVGMHCGEPGARSGIFRRHPGVLEPALVEVRRAAVRARGPDDLRHRVRQLSVARFARSLERCELALVESRRLFPQLPVLHP